MNNKIGVWMAVSTGFCVVFSIIGSIYLIEARQFQSIWEYELFKMARGLMLLPIEDRLTRSQSNIVYLEVVLFGNFMFLVGCINFIYFLFSNMKGLRARIAILDVKLIAGNILKCVLIFAFMFVLADLVVYISEPNARGKIPTGATRALFLAPLVKFWSALIFIGILKSFWILTVALVAPKHS